MKNLLIGTFCLFIFSACNEIDNKLLYGNWKGHQMLQDGKVIDSGAELVKFEFDANGNYKYELAHHKEAGPFRTVEDKLYTTDTIDAKRLEKVVRIKLITTDSLHIQMNKEGIDQLLKCFKVK